MRLLPNRVLSQGHKRNVFIKLVVCMLAAIFTLTWVTPACARKPKMSPQVRAAQKQAKARRKAMKRAKAKPHGWKHARTNWQPFR